LFEGLKLTVDGMFEKMENELGFSIDKEEMMTDNFWNSTM
jgi:hypothetical protein